MRVGGAARRVRMATRVSAIAATLLSWDLTATLASAQSDTPAPPPIPALDIDPTEQIDVRGWWSNGHELLLIQGDGSYKLWKGTNRFLAPDDIGRWDRQTYRTLWLETYRGQKHSRDRVQLRREAGTLLMSLRDLAPMQQLTRPPHTREDSLIGAWSGPPGTLTLRDDGTYAFAVAKSGPKDRQPARLGSHTGTWLVRDDTVVLTQGDRMKPVVATIVTPVSQPGAPSGATSPGSSSTAPGKTPSPAMTPSGPGSGAPATGTPASAGAPLTPPPHQLIAPEGTVIVLPGGELRREAMSGAPPR